MRQTWGDYIIWQIEYILFTRQRVEFELVPGLVNIFSSTQFANFGLVMIENLYVIPNSMVHITYTSSFPSKSYSVIFFMDFTCFNIS